MKVTSMLNGEDIILLNVDHEEADSIIFEHCEYFANQILFTDSVSKRIMIFSPDTEVAVLCWYHFIDLQIQELWFHTGMGKNRSFIPMDKAVEKVGADGCSLLPAIHALTGCDSTRSVLYIAEA